MTLGKPCTQQFAKRSHMPPTNTWVHTDTPTELEVSVEPWPLPPLLLLLPHVPLPEDLLHWHWA